VLLADEFRLLLFDIKHLQKKSPNITVKMNTLYLINKIVATDYKQYN